MKTMDIPFVDLKCQYDSIKSEIDTAMTEVISRSAFVGGPFVESFEKSFAFFCGVKHCISVGNGTDALFIALKALGIKQGDEVITVANTFIATSEAITMTGARVVLVDVNPKTLNIDVGKIEEKITSRTKVIIPVHLYGQTADMDPILRIAQKYSLRVVEDAAQAHGAMYKGRLAGSMGDIGCFSFYPGKNLGAYGDGGAIVTDNDEFATKARMFANHGRVNKYDHEFEGVNSRLDGIQAAILSIKLKHLPQWNENRRRNASLYNETLKGLSLKTPSEIDEVKSVYHLYVVRVEKKVREPLIEYLRTQGITTGIHYPIALPNLKAYAYLNARGECPESTKASEEILSLPMYPELEETQIMYVGDKIKEFGL